MSHIVKVFRIQQHQPLANVNDLAVKEWSAQAQISKGSRRTSATNPEIYTGLTVEQRNLLLPYLIEIPTDISYHERRRLIADFYNSLYAKIPAEGLSLEIGLKDAKKKLGEELNVNVNKDGKMVGDPEPNIPLNINEFLTYKALFENDPVVAKTKQLGDENPLMQFYIMDTISERKMYQERQEQRELAQSHYLSIRDDEKSITKMITVLKIQLKGDNAFMNKKEKLSEYANNFPEDYMKMAKDDNLDSRYIMQRLRNFKVIDVQPGGAFFEVNTGETIATDESQMVAFLKNPENSEKIALLRTSLQQKERV